MFYLKRDRCQTGKSFFFVQDSIPCLNTDWFRTRMSALVEETIPCLGEYSIAEQDYIPEKINPHYYEFWLKLNRYTFRECNSVFIFVFLL